MLASTPATRDPGIRFPPATGPCVVAVFIAVIGRQNIHADARTLDRPERDILSIGVSVTKIGQQLIGFESRSRSTQKSGTALDTSGRVGRAQGRSASTGLRLTKTSLLRRYGLAWRPMKVPHPCDAGAPRDGDRLTNEWSRRALVQKSARLIRSRSTDREVETPRGQGCWDYSRGRRRRESPG